ncbi:MAG TPA: hypothetical protein VHZ02_13655 [Acidimicrobiales bacterium]|nr:hypothetical protein [Acidimicrobiales bacterium]
MKGPKEEALREARSLNPRPRDVTSEAFTEVAFFDPEGPRAGEVREVRRVRVEGAAVADTSARFGFARPSWYAAAEALDERGLPGLVAGRPGLRRPHELTDEMVDFIERASADDPSLRAVDLVSHVGRHFHVSVHPRYRWNGHWLVAARQG